MDRPSHRIRHLRKGGARLNLLACFVLICVAVALVLPAIQAAREAARRTECNRNLRNVTVGLHSYHDLYKVLPMGAVHSGRNHGGDPPTRVRLGPSWWFGVQPYMGQCSLFDRMLDSQKP
jgi:hypothetical protein